VLARQGYFAPSAKELEKAAEASARTLEPKVAGALDTLAQRQPGNRPVDVWVGLSKGAEGRTRVVVAWDPAGPEAAGRVGGLDVTVATGRGAEIVPQRPPSAPGTGKPSRVAAAFEVPPGPFTLKYTAKGGDQSTLDTWSQPLAAPDWSAAPFAISSPRFFLAQSIAELRAIRASPDPPPTAVRQFRRSDRVLVALDCYTPRPEDKPLVQAHVLTRDGTVLTELPVPEPENGSVTFELPVGSLGQGTYILRLRVTLGTEQIEDMTAIVIAR
jgi:hypothetical protein